MINISIFNNRFKLEINGTSKKQSEFLVGLVQKIPGYEYNRKGKFYTVPFLELKFMVNILNKNIRYLDTKENFWNCYINEAESLKRSLIQYNPTSFLDTLDTDKDYDFLKLPPKSFQKVAIEWGSEKKGMAQIYGGLIADEVGLGKTIESISIACNLINKGVCKSGIILCPSNMGLQWKGEIEKFTDKSVRVILSKYKKEKRIDEYLNFSEDFLVIGHELYTKDAKEIQKEKKNNPNLDFSFIIVDEAHKMKNMETVLYKSISLINPPVKLLLTATPIKKDVDDLYALFNYLHPDILMGWNYFKNKFLVFAHRFGKVVPVGGNKQTEPFLHKLIAPYMIRRKSVDVSNEIPTLLENFVPITPTSEQRKWFGILSTEMEKAMKEAEEALKNDKIMLAQQRENNFKSRFMALSACSNHMLMLARSKSKLTQALVSKHSIKDLASPKMKWLIDFIENDVITNTSFFDSQKEKVVIFTQFERMIWLIDEEISRKLSNKYKGQLNVMHFTGKMGKGCSRVTKENLPTDCFKCVRKSECNSTEKSKFLFVNDPDVNILLCTDAAQAGINLQVARFLVNFDLPYSPGSVDQRNGRIKRIGSGFKEVIVYNLYIEGGPDEKTVNILMKRRDSIEQVVESTEDEKDAYAKHLPKM